MRLLISESEKRRILSLHKPRFLFEQSTDITIADLQSLIGVSVDNNLGPDTAKKLLEVLRSIPGNGCSANFVPPIGGGGGGGAVKPIGTNTGGSSNFIKSPTNYAQ
jgi:hypothetical protein